MGDSWNVVVPLLVGAFPLLLACLLLFPHRTCFGVVLLHLFLKPLQHALGGPDSLLGMAIKRADEFVIMGMAVVLAARAFRMGLRRFVQHRALLLAVLLGGACVASALLNSVSLAHLTFGTFLLVKCFIVYLFAYTSPRRDLSPGSVLRVFDVFFGLVVAGALLNLLLGTLWSELIGTSVFGYRLGLPRVHSFYRVPGSLGEVACMGTILWFCRYALTRDWRFFVWTPLLLVAMTAALVIKPIIALAFVLFLGLLLDRSFRRSLLPVVPLVLSGVAALLLPLYRLLAFRLGAYRQSYETTIRGLSYLHAGLLLLEKPLLGVGPAQYGGFGASFLGSAVQDRLGITDMQAATGWVTVDTYWPHLFAEVGLVGGGLFVLLLFVVGRKAMATRERAADPALKVLALASVFWLIQLCLTAFAAPVFEGAIVWFGPMWVLGYVANPAGRLAAAHVKASAAPAGAPLPCSHVTGCQEA